MGNPVSDSYGKLTDAFNSVTTSTTVPRMPAAPKEKNTGARGTGQNAAQVIASQKRAKRKTSNQRPKTVARRDAAAKAVKAAKPKRRKSSTARRRR